VIRNATPADYWGKIEGVYYTGDAAQVDEDGYFWFSVGRRDHKIAGHRIGRSSRDVVPASSACAEAGVTGRPDDLREKSSRRSSLRQGYAPSMRSRRSCSPLSGRARPSSGHLRPAVRVDAPRPVAARSCAGLEGLVMGNDVGDVSTIEDEGSSGSP